MTPLAASLLLLAAPAPPPASSAASSLADSGLARELTAVERRLYEGWKGKNPDLYMSAWADGAVAQSPFGPLNRATLRAWQVKAEAACAVASYGFSNVRAVQIAPDAARLTYVLDQDATCGGGKAPARQSVLSVYVRTPAGWRLAAQSVQGYQDLPAGLTLEPEDGR